METTCAAYRPSEYHIKQCAPCTLRDAAPEMLKALKDIADSTVYEENEHSEGLFRMCCRVVAWREHKDTCPIILLIEKAEGR